MTDAPLKEAEITQAIHDIMDPEIGRSLGRLEMVKQVRIEPSGATRVEIELPTPAYPNRERITQAIEKAIRAANPASTKPVEVIFSSRVRGKNTGGTLGLSIANIIAVGSGKGGVGKSTIAASLAYGLNFFGAKAGLMDAD